MSYQEPRRRGRKPVSSRATLEEAATQLFLEQGYTATTVDHITQRAGVSRTTFFNYFEAKSDVLWADIDDAVAEVVDELSVDDETADAAGAVVEAFTAVAARFSASQLPLAITQFDTMGAIIGLQESGVARFAQLAGAVHAFLDEHWRDDDRARVVAYALVGAVLAESINWAMAGVERGDLAARLQARLAPLCAGFAQASS